MCCMFHDICLVHIAVQSSARRLDEIDFVADNIVHRHSPEFYKQFCQERYLRTMTAYPLPCFSTVFKKGYNFCDFLFCFST